MAKGTAHQRKAASRFKACRQSVKADGGETFAKLQSEFGKCLREAWGKKAKRKAPKKRRSRKSRR